MGEAIWCHTGIQNSQGIRRDKRHQRRFDQKRNSESLQGRRQWVSKTEKGNVGPEDSKDAVFDAYVGPFSVQTAIASITHDLENRSLECKEEQPNGQIVEDIIVSGRTAIPSKEETSNTQQQLDILDGQDRLEAVAGTMRSVEPFRLNSDEQLIVDGQLKIAPEV
ncbi:hypothetical protein DM860_008996 [Cuscuta australis]|uniref:Uncharacterized protein n=1 Tax=Cuscuta australis TaxID=267555 RepID=A0A328D8P6_9ASTE|nr:hypothetical protein DM860_008996 [Cuscuta australis]